MRRLRGRRLCPVCRLVLNGFADQFATSLILSLLQPRLQFGVLKLKGAGRISPTRPYTSKPCVELAVSDRLEVDAFRWLADQDLEAVATSDLVSVRAFQMLPCGVVRAVKCTERYVS